MEHTVYSKTQEKVMLGDVKFTVNHLIPKMSQEVKETRKKEIGHDLYSIFKKYPCLQKL